MKRKQKKNLNKDCNSYTLVYNTGVFLYGQRKQYNEKFGKDQGFLEALIVAKDPHIAYECGDRSCIDIDYSS